jgi:type VI secretion system secreted protein Hcp
MTGDMFLKIDGVEGEAKDKTHGKEIDVLAWAWGASNAGSGSGKVKVHDLTITKNVDSSSPKLLLACFAGTHYPSALLTVRKAGGQHHFGND